MADRSKDELLRVIERKPWQSEPVPGCLENPKGMIGAEERSCYYWLGKEWYSGKGYVIDAGAFVGASTFCFAAGVHASGHHRFDGKPPIHAYDFFKVVDDYVGESISRDFRPVTKGESYLDVFEYQIGRFGDLITPHPGDFMQQQWAGEPVEILFIDISKTLNLNAHVVNLFFRCLIPGQSIVIHQDYYHCWHPYIHYSMEYFRDEFELVDEHVEYQSRVWRLIKPLPKEKVDRIARNELGEEERMALLNTLIDRSSKVMKPMIEVVRLWQACMDERWDWAAKEFERLAATYDLSKGRDLWARQALEVREQIRKAGALS